MCIEVVGDPVGEIERGERGFTPNGRSHAYSLDVACTCKRLALVIDVVCWVRYICVLR
jgi:hypothetical protein